MAEKILIVDDDVDTVEFLRLILNRQGFQTCEASNGMEALKMAHTQQPDLIILDVMMPGLNGYEVARSLRRQPDTSMIPILMFTAKTQVEDKLAGYEAGVNIYLTKPVHPVELQANIKALLTQRQTSLDRQAEKGYVIGVLAAKGGLGVSTLALNLAITCHQQTQAGVIAVELRPGQGTWAHELDLRAPLGLAPLLKTSPAEISAKGIENQLVSTPYGIRLLLASDESKDVDLALAVAQFETLVQQLALMSNMLVLDIGTNFNPAYAVITELCDEMILVTEPQIIVARRTRTLIDELRSRGFGSSKALTVVTMNHKRAEMTLSISQVEQFIGYAVNLSFPPAAELAYLAAERNVPLCLAQPEGIINQQFHRLAEQVLKRAKP